jgi:hypothetical protein
VNLLYPSIIELEEAMIARLKNDSKLTGWKVHVTSVPGLSKVSEIAQLFSCFPAIGTYSADGIYKTANSITEETCPLWILCAGQNLRSPSAPSRGDKNSPGSLHILNRCRDRIESWERHGNLKSIQPTDWRLAWCNKQIAVHVLRVEVEITRPQALTDEEIETYGQSY